MRLKGRGWCVCVCARCVCVWGGGLATGVARMSSVDEQSFSAPVTNGDG